MNANDRKTTLLNACFALLQKQNDSPYVLNLLCETVFYDEADCDGYCLMEDIKNCLEETGTNADVIRGMSDCELAHWLSTTFCQGYGESDFLAWLAKNCEEETHGKENA